MKVPGFQQATDEHRKPLFHTTKVRFEYYKNADVTRSGAMHSFSIKHKTPLDADGAAPPGTVEFEDEDVTEQRLKNCIKQKNLQLRRKGEAETATHPTTEEIARERWLCLVPVTHKDLERRLNILIEHKMKERKDAGAYAEERAETALVQACLDHEVYMEGIGGLIRDQKKELKRKRQGSVASTFEQLFHRRVIVVPIKHDVNDEEQERRARKLRKKEKKEAKKLRKKEKKEAKKLRKKETKEAKRRRKAEALCQQQGEKFESSQ